MACCAQRAGNAGLSESDRSRSRPPPRRVWPGMLLCASLLALSACGDPAAEGFQLRLDSIQEALAAGENSAALRKARSVLVEQPDSSVAGLGAAQACLGLDRFNEAADYATTGLEHAGQDSTLVADLHWAQGKAFLALYLQLQAEADWRTANSALERGADPAGTHRADAAYALVRMQGLGGLGSDGRRDRFSQMFLKIEPSGARADTVRALTDGGESR